MRKIYSSLTVEISICAKFYHYISFSILHIEFNLIDDLSCIAGSRVNASPKKGTCAAGTVPPFGSVIIHNDR